MAAVGWESDKLLKQPGLKPDALGLDDDGGGHQGGLVQAHAVGIPEAAGAAAGNRAATAR